MAEAMDERIQKIVQDIITDVEQEHKGSRITGHRQPDREVIIDVIHAIQAVLFPAHFGSKRDISDFAVKYEIGGLLEQIYTSLSMQILRALRHHPVYQNESKAVRREKANELAAQFIEKLPTIRAYLKTDIQAAYDGDPAAFNKDEIIFSYPGFYAIVVNRIAHELYLLDIPLIPRIMSEYVHGKTGIDIHPGAAIGKYFFIDHGTGVVIGETTTIGDHAKLYQGVTLGGLSTRAGQGLSGVKRHPTIRDNVTIYSNASVLGGDTVIGEGCVIGGNCFITRSIPAHMRVSNPSFHLEMRPDESVLGSSTEYWSYEI